MSLRGSCAKKEKRPYTRLEKGLLAFAVACFAGDAIMYLNYWNAFSQAPRVILGYYTAEAAAAVQPGADVLGDGDEWNAYESAEGEVRASFYEYGATNEYEMFASMFRDVLMGVRGGDTAAPRCTALVKEAIQDGSAYDPPSFDGLTER